LSRPSESLPGRAKVSEARNLVKAEHVQSDPRSRDAARTREDGSTNFRLLRLLGCDVKTGLAARLESVPPMEVDAVAPPSYPRALLNYYLEHGQGRL
jgi:hypothetical protein